MFIIILIIIIIVIISNFLKKKCLFYISFSVSHPLSQILGYKIFSKKSYLLVLENENDSAM